MEDNNNKKGRGRPKKVKNEESDSKITDESSLKQEDDDDIRLPDEPKVERLNYFEYQDDDLHKAIIESMKEKNNLEEDFLKESEEEFLKESEEEYIFQQFVQQINIEEIEKRSLSLPQFTKRLERLCFSESDRAIKAIIEPIIIEYKLNKRNNIVLNTEVFNNIYDNFINTLYQKPISLGKTTTMITKNEDILIRQIFLKKE